MLLRKEHNSDPTSKRTDAILYSRRRGVLFLEIHIFSHGLCELILPATEGPQFFQYKVIGDTGPQQGQYPRDVMGGFDDARQEGIEQRR